MLFSVNLNKKIEGILGLKVEGEVGVFREKSREFKRAFREKIEGEVGVF